MCFENFKTSENGELEKSYEVKDGWKRQRKVLPASLDAYAAVWTVRYGTSR